MIYVRMFVSDKDNISFFSTIDHDRMIFYVKCDRDVKVEVNFHFLYHIY